MKNINKKRVFLSSAVSILLFSLLIGTSLGYGSLSSPQSKTDGTFNDTFYDDDGYYSLSVTSGAYITIGLTYSPTDVNYDIKIELDDPDDSEVEEDRDTILDGSLSIEHTALMTGTYILHVYIDRDLSSATVTITISGLTGGGLPGGSTLMVEWIIIGTVAVAGIAAVVVIYKKV